LVLSVHHATTVVFMARPGVAKIIENHNDRAFISSGGNPKRDAFDKQGDTLVFGSTTGSLYLSENRGETWRCLGQNYPPIYSVRFPR
jgi:hypothetical protein